MYSKVISVAAALTLCSPLPSASLMDLRTARFSRMDLDYSTWSNLVIQILDVNVNNIHNSITCAAMCAANRDRCSKWLQTVVLPWFSCTRKKKLMKSLLHSYFFYSIGCSGLIFNDDMCILLDILSESSTVATTDGTPCSTCLVYIKQGML